MLARPHDFTYTTHVYTKGVEANVRQVVSREKAVVELPIRANLRTLHSTSDEIGFCIFLPKPLQHRKQNRRKWDVACRRAAFLGCGDHDLGPSRAIELLSIDALGKEDRSVIVYNDKIRILNIPLRAYEWQVNGKSPIEWIMERYAVTVNRDSQIETIRTTGAESMGSRATSST